MNLFNSFFLDLEYDVNVNVKIDGGEFLSFGNLSKVFSFGNFVFVFVLEKDIIFLFICLELSSNFNFVLFFISIFGFVFLFVKCEEFYKF